MYVYVTTTQYNNISCFQAYNFLLRRGQSIKDTCITAKNSLQWVNVNIMSTNWSKQVSKYRWTVAAFPAGSWTPVSQWVTTNLRCRLAAFQICSQTSRVESTSLNCRASNRHTASSSSASSSSSSSSSSSAAAAAVVIIIITRGQSNLTKSASWGAHSPVRGHPRGSKVVPLNSWGRVSY